MKTLLLFAASIIFAFLSKPIYSVPPEWFEELERQWIDEGHLPELTEDEIQYRRTERRRMEAVSKLNEYMRSGSSTRKADIDGMLRKVDEIGRPILMTATLTEAYKKANKYNDQDDLTWDQEADKCDEWLVRLPYVKLSYDQNPMIFATILVHSSYLGENLF